MPTQVTEIDSLFGPINPEPNCAKQKLPKCAVRGVLNGGRAMCGSIIVGLVSCGAAGECEHKVAAQPAKL